MHIRKHRGSLVEGRAIWRVFCAISTIALMGCSSDMSAGAGGGGSSGVRSSSERSESDVRTPSSIYDSIVQPFAGGLNEEDPRPWGYLEKTAAALPRPVNAQSCTSGSECASGFCVDGVCCNSACTGTCEACTAAKKGSGEDGICGVIALYGDPDNECADGSCDGTGACKLYNGATCSAAATCLSGNCVDGFCCGNACTGSCMACSIAKRGGGYNGQCGPIAVGTDPDNECGQGACSGNGTCEGPSSCSSGGDCPSGFCVDGVCCDSACTGTCEACTAVKKGSGSDGTCGPIALYGDPDNECLNGSCNGVGLCQYYNGVPCGGTTECLSGHCVDGYCCGASCAETCLSCSAAKKGGGYNGQCGPVVLGTDPDGECPGSACSGGAACVALLDNGTACSSGGQCTSGFCVDGVCCNSACTETCNACTTLKKGSGSNGQCGAIAANIDPDNECPTGDCNGAGQCTTAGTLPNGSPCSESAACSSGFCVDGVCCDSACTETCRACTTAKKGNGMDGMCGAIALSADPDNECVDGVCDGAGGCKRYNGATCATTADCLSNNCVDGFCCGNLCAGTCMSCSAAKRGGGFNGQCGPIAAGTDPDSECSAGTCNGTGQCVAGTTGSPCASASECSSGHCVDGFCCAEACASTCQACSAAKKGSGVNGQCGPIAVGTDPDEECATSCDGSGACATTGLGDPCSVGTDCSSGFCVDGVCCNSDCGGLCEACSAVKKGSGTDGTCGPIALYGDPDNECASGTCDGAGTCKYLNGVACSMALECLSNYCVDGVCCGNACADGCFACSAAKKGGGFDGVCGPVAAGTDTDNDCEADTCNGAGSCTARWANWPMPNPASSGLPNPASYTVDALNDTVLDNVTRLLWQRTVPTTNFTRETAEAFCAALVLGGYDDWRLPSRIELASLVDNTKTILPSIDTNAFPNTPSAAFLTNTRLATDPTMGWTVSFNGGVTSFAGAQRARCVRGPVAP